MSNVELMNKGMWILNRELGNVEAERFISIILQEQFDYTKWQREYFDAMTPTEFSEAASEYADEHPFNGKMAKIV